MSKVESTRLVEVVSEIVERLVADDWMRLSEAGDGRFYYIVGADAQADHATGDGEFEEMEISEPAPYPAPSAEAFIRAQLASELPDHLRAVRKRVVDSGVPAELVDAVLAGDESVLAKWDFSSLDRIQDLSELCDASYAKRLRSDTKKLEEAPDDPETHAEIRRTRAKLYLGELACRYGKMMERSGELPPLDFADAQLEEASRCYLQGFNRAAVVLSAAVLEADLKRVAGWDRFECFQSLIEQAMKVGLLGAKDAESAGKVFRVRNDVLHEGRTPELATTRQALLRARDLVAKLRASLPFVGKAKGAVC